tara:strand:- start:36 stop:491 length:456 start_codon:yes stop_codon:yes gene_type:complete
MSYARGKYAYGFCDRTGFRYPLSDLVPEFNNGVKTGFLVGRDMADPDQPQNFLGRLKIFDPQSLQNSRPDTSLDQSRRLFGFDPVWNDAQFAVADVGKVTITTTETETDNIVGVSATGSVGLVTVSVATTAPSFDSTSITLDSTTDTFDEG